MKAKYYLSVAECLNIAFGAAGTKNKAMDGAIKVMTLHPEWCAIVRGGFKQTRSDGEMTT